ncbi:MAG: molybdopterin-dependent oxidoreductase [Desulfitobacterium sp.]|nr:molybdopterin-dependent oxidoreductase [Desulfitobacterium sp.]
MRNHKIVHNVCPRNCYETCSILSHVENDKLVKVEGNILHGYTRGRLCAKGYALTEYVYHPERLKYPIKQFPRGSGNWQRISWEEALGFIAEKIIELHDRYGSSLACGYNKYSGNIGVLHQATEGMFRGLGPHTIAQGDVCLAAGNDALIYNREKVPFKDPEDMAKAKGIVLWGVNPARTATHQWFFINKARDQGAKLLVIDPLYTPTAAQGDIFLQIKPGTDGMLAMATLKILLEKGKLDEGYIKEHFIGWETFKSYLLEEVELSEASKITGVPLEGIKELAALYESKNCATWVGFGLQRYSNGGQTVRVIDALVTLTGNYGEIGGGIYYNNSSGIFPINLKKFPRPPEQEKTKERIVDINHFASEVLALKDPPLKLLWIAGRNPLTQDQDIDKWHQLFRQLELIVTVDMFMNEIAAQSDFVLPAATFFEDYDLNYSYWHHWIGINQPAIPPYYEAKSDLEIARLLTKELNKRRPGFSSFPAERTALDWIEGEFTPEVLARLGIKNWRELLQSPRKLIPPSEKSDHQIHLFSQKAKEGQLPALARFTPPLSNPSYPLRLLTPQSLSRIHSQYSNLSWLDFGETSEEVEMNPQDAQARNLEEKDTVLIFNEGGTCERKVRLNKYLPEGVVLASQGGQDPINKLFTGLKADMGILTGGMPGGAYYDVWVEVKKND